MLGTRRNQIREEYTYGLPDRIKCLGHSSESWWQDYGPRVCKNSQHNNLPDSRRRPHAIFGAPNANLTREIHWRGCVRLCSHRQLADARSDWFAGGGAGNVTIGQEIAHYERFLIFQRHTQRGFVHDLYVAVC